MGIKLSILYNNLKNYSTDLPITTQIMTVVKADVYGHGDKAEEGVALTSRKISDAVKDVMLNASGRYQHTDDGKKKGGSGAVVYNDEETTRYNEI